MLLVLFIVFVAGCGKTAKTNAALPEVRNSGTAIQWKYPAEEEWRDLVALTELRGASGENGKDGINGVDGKDGKNGTNGENGKDGVNGTDGKNGVNGTDGKDGLDGKDGIDGKDGTDGKDGINGKDGVDGINAKNIEVQRTETHIQWRYEGEEWQNLVAIADIEGPAGQNGTDGANGNTLQWRYVGDEIWLNLYDLTALKGADGRDGTDGKDGADGINGKDGIDGADGKDGTNGQNGSDGKDGKTPFIGENGNWWFGEIDTAVKAAGVDGEKGDKGEKGEKGDKGDKGEKGDAGQNGSCSGYFYGEANAPRTVLNNSRVNIDVYEKINKGGLISSYRNNITLKKGHIYNVCLSGSLEVGSNEFNNSGNYSIQMTDGYDNDLCRELTRIKRDGAKIPYTNDQHSFNFNRMYDASNKDITLQLWFENSAYNTYLGGFRGTITITALD